MHWRVDAYLIELEYGNREYACALTSQFPSNRWWHLSVAVGMFDFALGDGLSLNSRALINLAAAGAKKRMML